MDDILLFSTKDVDTQSLLDDCYLPPLKLESAGNGTFLETSFAITSGNRITRTGKKTIIRSGRNQKSGDMHIPIAMRHSHKRGQSFQHALGKYILWPATMEYYLTVQSGN